MKNFLFRLIKFILIISFMLFFAVSIMINGFPQSLFNRTKKPEMYTVRSGEDLIAVAARKNVKYLDLLAANKIPIADTMVKRAGEKLIIPRGLTAEDKQIYLSYQELYLKELKRENKEKEADLADLDSRIASEKRVITGIQRRKMAKPAIRNFNARVDSYNKLVKLYKRQYSDYDAAVKRMNTLVSTYNRFAESFNKEEEQNADR